MNLKQRIATSVQSRRFWLVIAIIYVIARSATWLFPFDSDTWIFYYVGTHWFHGSTLYLRVWDHKAPLIFFLNGLMGAVLGDNIVIQRIFLTLLSVASVYMFYRVARRILLLHGIKSWQVDARVATLIFVFWINLSQFTNSGNNTENYGVLALLLTVYLFLRWQESGFWKWLLYSGVAASFLVTLKINFVILLIPLALGLLISQRKNYRKLVGLLAIWAAPTVAQIIVWYSYFAPHNLLRQLWIASVAFNGKYLRAGWKGNLSGQAIFVAVLGAGMLFFLPGIIVAWQKRRDTKAGFALPVAGSALLFGAILGTFYSHYYLVIIPYMSLVSAVYWREIVKSKIWLSLLVLSAVLSFGISTKQLINRFHGAATVDAQNMSAAADYVHDHTNSSDTVVYYGYGATFYELAHRDSGSRFVSASHPLMDEREGFGYGFDDQYIGDMASTRSKYVVINRDTKDLYSENSRVMKYFSGHYHLEILLTGYEVWRHN